jgi:hypothetical protein
LCYDFLKLHPHHPVEFAKAPIHYITGHI